MATYTLSINENSDKAKNFLRFLEDYAKDNRFFEIDRIPNEETLQAIKDVEEGRTFEAKDVGDLFRQLEE